MATELTWHEKMKAQGLCISCAKPSRPGKTQCQPCADKKNSQSIAYSKTGKRKKWQKDRTVKDRVETINRYGGKCVCCGEQRHYFLTFDHVNNDGNLHLKANGIRYKGNELVRWAIRNNYPNTLQIMCWNCNCAKALNNGVCPCKLS